MVIGLAEKATTIHIPNMVNAAIKVENLSKHFGNIVAVDNLTFEIEEGSLAALLGGNGAGKTTTISLLLGLLIPTSGQLQILGVDMLHDRYSALADVNFSSPYVDLPKRLTVRENLMVYAKLYGVADPVTRLRELASDLDIEKLLDRPFGELSSGQRTRVSLAKALLNEPKLLLLDEPTASLDPETTGWIRDLLDHYCKKRNATIMFASHDMREVELLCDEVLLLSQGELVEQGSPRELLSKYDHETLEEVFLQVSKQSARE